MKKWTTCVLLISAAFTAQAGVSMVTEEASGATVTKTYMEGEQVRVDVDSENRMSIYFDGDKGLFRMVNHEDRSYMELDKETLLQMTAAMDQAMKQMEESLKGLPSLLSW